MREFPTVKRMRRKGERDLVTKEEGQYKRVTKEEKM